MSSKSSYFLTNENEHCYYDSNRPIENDGDFVGYEITMELSKQNIRIDINDSEDLVITFTKDSEIFRTMKKALESVREK